MEETVFQMVLVDMKRAANENEIHCVESPLTTESDGGLNFVALSYRWGELAGTVVDTNLGYVASVTSFDLNDFYTLCKGMTQEPDLKYIDYVWVDAICVDQIDYERRKATIYRMTDIYERANYIVAIPDLHLRYLKDIHTKNKQIIDRTAEYNRYIYHLIQENITKLIELDEQWLDEIGVPKDRALRQMLTNHTTTTTTTTSHFGDAGFIHKVHDTADYYDTKDALYHIQKSVADTHASRCHSSRFPPSIDKEKATTAYPGYTIHFPDPLKDKLAPQGGGGGDIIHDEFSLDDLTIVNQPNSKDADWPCYVIKEIKHDQWKQQISQRSAIILQSMDFLEDLIKDWSSRVWVMNEYTIAKKKKNNKMKYWFIQLEVGRRHDELDGLSFFEFNFDDLSSIKQQDTTCIFNARTSCHHALTTKSNFIYQKFRKTMQCQLSQQTFLETVLKSKATRNEDRFHAVFPLSKYKDKLGSKDVVDSWKINSIIAVKLKLFELMDTKDKLDLLFLSGMSSSSSSSNNNTTMVLPTFATSRIEWPESGQYASSEAGGGGGTIYPCNFDLAKTTTLLLIPTHTTTCSTNEYDKMQQSKLNLKPHEYYICRNAVFAEKVLEKNRTLCKRLLQFDDDDPEEERIEMVCIPSYGDSDRYARRHCPDYKIRQLFLIGSFKKNKWMVTASSVFTLVDATPVWTLHYTHSNNVGFDIY